MSEVCVEISRPVCGFSAKRPLTTKETWARYIQSRLADDPLFSPQKEWGLSAWEARSISEQEISQQTVDKIFRKEGFRAPMLALDILLVQCQITCHDLADHLDREAENERLRTEARQKPRRRVALRLAPDRSFAPPVDGEGG